MTTTETYTLPVYWASYLINGDASGLQEGEAEQIDRWLSSEGLHRRDALSVGDDQWFQHMNDATSLGGDVTEYTFAR